ncbi:sulfite exporter TauE/SafE family protein [Brachybacterium huguangmaarense]
MVLLTLAVGLGIGVVVGALGAGGGILAVPVLVYLLGQDPHAATASSLVIVGLTALVSIRHHARAGNVAWREGLVFALVSVVGAVVGSRASGLVPPRALMLAFALLLGAVAVVMIRRAVRTRREERADAPAGSAPSAPGGPDPDAAELDSPEPDSPEPDAPVLDVPGPDTHATAGVPEASRPPAHAGSHRAPRTGPSWPVLAAAATATGLLTGFFGVGGGFIVVPMLVIALGLAMRRASGTSLLVMIVSTAVSLLARIGTDVQIDWAVTLVFAAASSMGGILGGPLSARAKPSTLTWCFAILLAAVALVTLGENLLG